MAWVQREFCCGWRCWEVTVTFLSNLRDMRGGRWIGKGLWISLWDCRMVPYMGLIKISIPNHIKFLHLVTLKVWSFLIPLFLHYMPDTVKLTAACKDPLHIRSQATGTIFLSHRSYSWCCPTHWVMWRGELCASTRSIDLQVDPLVRRFSAEWVWAIMKACIVFGCFCCCLSAGATSKVIVVIQFAHCWGVGAQKRDKVWWNEGGYQLMSTGGPCYQSCWWTSTPISW